MSGTLHRGLNGLLAGSALLLASMAAQAQDFPTLADQQAEGKAFVSDLAPEHSQDLPEPGRLANTQPQPADEDLEVVVERYSNGATKTERQVLRDKEDNYVNHGQWSQWNASGELIGSGAFRHGRRHGHWERWFEAGEAPMLSGANFRGFTAPLVSQATFADGELHGAWTIQDAKGRKVGSWQFDQGELHGTATWWFPSGHRRLQAHYKHGQLSGEFVQWALERTRRGAGGNGLQHKLVSQVTYKEGRRHERHVEWYAPGQKKLEGTYLTTEPTQVAKIDWFGGVFEIKSAGEKQAQQRHHVWTSWYPNGNKQWEGEFDHDQSTGEHVWWHASGLKRVEGQYRDGMESGEWTWWHAGGQKHMQGEYMTGEQIGVWTKWDAASNVLEMQRFDVDTLPAAEAPRLVDASPDAEDAVEESQEAAQPPVRSALKSEPQSIRR